MGSAGDERLDGLLGSSGGPGEDAPATVFPALDDIREPCLVLGFAWQVVLGRPTHAMVDAEGRADVIKRVERQAMGRGLFDSGGGFVVTPASGIGRARLLPAPYRASPSFVC